MAISSEKGIEIAKSIEELGTQMEALSCPTAGFENGQE